HGRELRCFLMRNEQRVVAALPFCVQTMKLWPLKIKLAKIVGSDATISILFPPIGKGYEKAAIKAAMSHLLLREHCDLISLWPLSHTSDASEAARDICMNDNKYMLIRSEKKGVYSRFHLPETFDKYVANLKPKDRNEIKRRRKILETRFAVETR